MQGDPCLPFKIPLFLNDLNVFAKAINKGISCYLETVIIYRMWAGVGSEGFYFGGGDHLIFKDNGRGNES